MGLKTIKGVDEQTWHKFKILAAQEKKSSAAMFQKIVDMYCKDADKFWDSFLNCGKILTDEEAEMILETSRSIRKSFKLKEL